MEISPSSPADAPLPSTLVDGSQLVDVGSKSVCDSLVDSVIDKSERMDIQENGERKITSDLLIDSTQMEISDDLISSATVLPQQTNGHRNGMDDSGVDFVSVDNV